VLCVLLASTFAKGTYSARIIIFNTPSVKSLDEAELLWNREVHLVISRVAI